MKRSAVNKIFIIGILSSVVFLPNHKISGQNYPITPERSEQIIDKIYEKYIPVYKKYRGVGSVRNIDIIEYNPNTNTLINRSHVSLIRKDYFYKKSEIEILEYIKNDKVMQPSEYENRIIEIPDPILDENGRKLYLTRITNIAAVSKQKCYQMKVVPRKKTAKYFGGFLYFKMDTLELMLLEGSLGDLPFSFKEYSMKYFFEHEGDLPVLKSGSFIMRTYIPVLQPDRRFVISVNVIESKLL
ncbi:MAG: hypothetical protein A2W19_03685 [Spirochaetes bacterium RBG_16_49_21]|nr:MAG: hypothetical protein A2W19_03685 [Spirochaetes bacterium RBG_16_49_21]